MFLITSHHITSYGTARHREVVGQPSKFDVELLGNCDVAVGELCARLGWDLPDVEIKPIPGEKSVQGGQGGGTGRRRMGRLMGRLRGRKWGVCERKRGCNRGTGTVVWLRFMLIVPTSQYQHPRRHQHQYRHKQQEEKKKKEQGEGQEQKVATHHRWEQRQQQATHTPTHTQ